MIKWKNIKKYKHSSKCTCFCHEWFSKNGTCTNCKMEVM